MPSKIKYPSGPCPPEPLGRTELVKINGKEEIVELSMLPGEGINAQPLESLKYLDLEFPMGVGAGVVISLTFQLGKWNYDREKIDSFIEVTPVFTEYYQKTMEEKRKLEGQIKSGFASLTQAVQDFELMDHDLRKYREFLDYFIKVENSKEKLEEAQKKKDEKTIEDAKKEYLKAQHVLRAMFVDQVDAHTGEGLSMRSIAPRWPTIISDFMELFDDEDDPDEIRKRLDISKAEAIILTTKNNLYSYWKKTFYTTVKQRYGYLRAMTSARKESITEYRDQIMPLLSRYKALTEMREVEGHRRFLQTYSYWRPDAQALSFDISEIWAWKPFTVKEEPFKSSREAYDKITLKEAGFNSEEIKELRKAGIETIPAMPAVPIMDKYVRGVMKQIQAAYKIKMTAVDVAKIVQKLSDNFKTPEVSGTPAVPDYTESAIRAGPRWEFSPYFIFLRIPIYRLTLKLPNGGMLDDIIFNGMQAFNSTQNVIIGRLLELEAMKREMERKIGILLGTVDPETFEKMDYIVKKEYPDIYAEEEKERKKIKEEKKKKEEEKESKLKKASDKLQNFREKFTDFRSRFGKFLAKLGLNMMWFYPGPYEKLMHERMSKMMQRGPGVAFLEVDTFLKRKAGVPGV